MILPEEEYLSFVFPAVMLFIIGLKILLKGNEVKYEYLFANLKNHSVTSYKIGLLLFISGVLFSFISAYVPESLVFFITLLSYLKCVGLFYIIYESTLKSLKLSSEALNLGNNQNIFLSKIPF